MPFRLPLLLLLLVQLLGVPAHAARFSLFEDEFEEEKKPWDELQAQLPAYPNLAEALAFEVPPLRPAQFFIDPKSISIGADGVVRYSLIIKSGSGSLQVSYEGIRCETREKKLYAFGRKQGDWSRNRFAKWEEIPSNTRDPQHNFLYNDFFCPEQSIVDSADEAISALMSGVHPRAKR
jgi:hypothetical protein